MNMPSYLAGFSITSLLLAWGSSDDFMVCLSVAQIPFLEAHGLEFPRCGRFAVPLGSLDEQLVFLISLAAPERSVHACYTATK